MAHPEFAKTGSMARPAGGAHASTGAAAGGGARTSEGVRHVDAPLVHLAQQNPDHPPLASLRVHAEEVVHGRKQHERVHHDVARVERVRQHLLRHAGPRGQPILRAPSDISSLSHCPSRDHRQDRRGVP